MPKPRRLKVPEAHRGTISRAHHEKLEGKVADALKKRGSVHSAKGRKLIQRRLQLLRERETRIGGLSPEEKAEREIELGMLKRFKHRTYPKDPKAHRWLTQIRNRADLFGAHGAGARAGGEWRELWGRIKKGEFKDAGQYRRANEVLDHLEHDCAMYAVWAEHPDAHLLSDEEMERKIAERKREFRALR